MVQVKLHDTDLESHLHELEHVMGRLMWLEHKRFGQLLAEHNLTVPQFLVLGSLAERENGCAMGALANETLQSYPTMTGIVDRLEKEKLVQRRRGDALDRRQVLVELTAEGRALLGRAKRSRRASFRRALMQLPDSQLHEFIHLLEVYTGVYLREVERELES